MTTPRYIIDNLPAQVKIPYLHWTEYMESNLSFNLAIRKFIRKATPKECCFMLY